jgi:very-short-patch-repair endonuclease
MHKRKFRYILGQFLNNLTGFTTFLESESEYRAYDVLKSTGLTVKKQYRIDWYSLDFYLPKHRICIEIDGQDHSKRTDKDRIRDSYLTGKGIRTLRIPAEELYKAGYEKKLLKALKNFQQSKWN